MGLLSAVENVTHSGWWIMVVEDTAKKRISFAISCFQPVGELDGESLGMSSYIESQSDILSVY